MPQPFVGVATGLCALLSLTASWIAPGAFPGAGAALLALCLVLAMLVAYRFPIHVRHQTKVYMTVVPCYLMAALLPPPLAATAAALGSLGGELPLSRQKGLRAGEIATEVGRRALIVLLGALVAHLPQGTLAQGTLAQGPLREAVSLVGAAAVLFAADVITFPLLLARVSREPALRLMIAVAREAYAVEGVQYLLGIVGAVAAREQLWTLVVLAILSVPAYQASKRSTEMQDGTRQLLENMADAVDLRDPYTGGHSRRVTEYCAAILRELRLHGPEVDLILWAARVHDIGKIGVPDAVLNKPGPLDPEERAIMESHAARGAALLRRHTDFARGVEFVLHHHESWDGSGYPQGLKGTAIPFGARVIAVADSFDAMTSDRPYRRGMSRLKASAILREGRGRQWDAALVDALLQSREASLDYESPSPLPVVPDPGAPATPPAITAPAARTA